MSLLLIAALGTSAACNRSWEVRISNGTCRVAKGWKQTHVATVCGAPRATGWQPKVVNGWLEKVCSAPGDVYGKQVVLYDCQGNVWAVKSLPAPGFVGPPLVSSLVELLDYDEQRESAIRELGEMGPEAQEAVPRLKQLLTDSRPEVRQAAAEALRRIETR